MIEKIEIYWGADRDFESATESLENAYFLTDVIAHINKTDIQISGIPSSQENPMEVENLIIHTDDYGGIKEWAVLGFSNNVLLHLKVNIKNIWLCNPPDKIYKDIIRTFESAIIHEHKHKYKAITIEDMKRIAEGFNKAVIGQPHVIKQALSSIYTF